MLILNCCVARALQDAIEQAYSQDVSGQQAAAARTYRTALDVLQVRPLLLPAPSVLLAVRLHSSPPQPCK